MTSVRLVPPTPIPIEGVCDCVTPGLGITIVCPVPVCETSTAGVIERVKRGG
jgi:hypothetical protein